MSNGKECKHCKPMKILDQDNEVAYTVCKEILFRKAPYSYCHFYSDVEYNALNIATYSHDVGKLWRLSGEFPQILLDCQNCEFTLADLHAKYDNSNERIKIV